MGTAENQWEREWREREWVSYREASALVGLSRGTLHKLISAGEIRATKAGKAVRINRRSLTSWMNEHPYANR
jgi:excisionase family DNA binding protein